MTNILTKAEIDALLGRAEPDINSHTHIDNIYQQAGEAVAAYLTQLMSNNANISLSGVYKTDKYSLHKRSGSPSNTSLLATKVSFSTTDRDHFWILVPINVAILLDEQSIRRKMVAIDSFVYAGLTRVIEEISSQLLARLMPQQTHEAIVGPLQHWFSETERESTLLSDDDHFVLELTFRLPGINERLLILVPCENRSIVASEQPLVCTDISTALASIPLSISVQIPAGQHLIGAVAKWRKNDSLCVSIFAGCSVEVFANGQLLVRGVITQQSDGHLAIKFNADSKPPG
jgi:hypothetical protein